MYTSFNPVGSAGIKVDWISSASSSAEPVVSQEACAAMVSDPLSYAKAFMKVRGLWENWLGNVTCSNQNNMKDLFNVVAAKYTQLGGGVDFGPNPQFTFHKGKVCYLEGTTPIAVVAKALDEDAMQNVRNSIRDLSQSAAINSPCANHTECTQKALWLVQKLCIAKNTDFLDTSWASEEPTKSDVPAPEPLTFLDGTQAYPYPWADLDKTECEREFSNCEEALMGARN